MTKLIYCFFLENMNSLTILVFIICYYLKNVSTNEIKTYEFCTSSLAKTFEYESTSGFSVI